MTRRRSLLMLFIIFGLSIILMSQCAKSVDETEDKPADKVIAGVGKSNNTTSTKENQTLRITVSMKPKEFNQLKDRSTQYSENNEGLIIELINEPNGYAELKRSNEIGNGPDLMLLDNHWVSEFAALGFLRPMEEFFTGEQQSHGITTLINQVKWNGYLWAIPKDADPYILVWNNTIAADNNWQHGPESIDEWLVWNKALMHPESEKYGIYVNPADPYAFLSLLSVFTSNQFESSYLAGLKDTNTIAKIESFLAPQEEVFNSILLKKNYPAISASWDPWAMLRKGTIAAMVTTVSEFKLHESSDLTISALASTSLDNYQMINNGLLKGRSYAISSRSKNELLAINWIKAMTSVGTDLIAWDEAKLFPSIPTAYLVAPSSSDSSSTSYLWLINNGKILPVEPQTNKKINDFKNEWYQVWEGKQTITAFLNNTAKLWSET